MSNDNVCYLDAVFSNPTTQIVIFFPFIWMVSIEDNVAISTEKFTNIFNRNWSFGTAIDTPNLANMIFEIQAF